MEYTREKLIEICEKAIVPETKWHDRDSPRAQMHVGECWALLKAGCEFTVITTGNLATNEDTIWLGVRHKTFNTFEHGDEDDYKAEETYYLPTDLRLKANKNLDWY